MDQAEDSDADELVNITSAANQSGIVNSPNVTVNTTSPSGFETHLMVPLYIVIFLLAILGNTMVLLTLGSNKRMRTVTNVYLLNLAVSDLLLGVFCIPFTLVGQILQNFVFGSTMCKLIPYFQAVSVSVGVWTLVAISLERYFAICRPLRSRRWQTRSHACKMIAVVWSCSLACNIPILLVSRLQAMRQPGRHKCREDWSSQISARTYNLFLDVVLLLVPLLVMGLAYALIVSKLWKGLRCELRHPDTPSNLVSNSNHLQVPGMPCQSNIPSPLLPSPPSIKMAAVQKMTLTNSKKKSSIVATATSNLDGLGRRGRLWCLKRRLDRRFSNSYHLSQMPTSQAVVPPPPPPPTPSPEESRLVSATNPLARHHAIRSNYMDKSIEAKKKVIRMLFVVVAEFFVCWAPLHLVNTWSAFSYENLYSFLGQTGIGLIHLLAYCSSCCNPITYCFMNNKFRQAFLGLFRCYCTGDPNSRGGNSGFAAGGASAGGPGRAMYQTALHHSEDSTVFVERASIVPRSEILELDGEARV